MKRRDFMNWIGVGAIATSLPIAIAACTPKGEPSANGQAADDNNAAEKGATAGEFVAIGTITELSQQGFLADDDVLNDPVIVIEDPANPDGLIALSAKCTHTGCTVAWQEDLFACPCHGSKFNPDGSVVTGPASAPLAKYTAKIEGEDVLVASI
ncbi:MAG: ubiquinol-cytochrome c reductase iron-sulfur subunit [Cyanobacteria bacterium J06627_32]